MADNPRYTVTISPKRGGVPIGGTTGQVLKKLSNGNWDSDWEDESSGGATSFPQLTGTLALSQTSMNTNKLLGRGTAGTGVFEEITLGTNLSLAGTTLNAAGGGGTPGGSNTQVQSNSSGAFAGITGATTNGTALTLTAPILGTPASGTLTNCTGYTFANIASTPTTISGYGITDGVVGPDSSVDSHLARYNGATGKLIKASISASTYAIWTDAGELDLFADDANPANAKVLLTLNHTTTGTPAPGIGSRMQFTSESLNKTNDDTLNIDGVFSDVGVGTATSYVDFMLRNNGALIASKARLFGSGGLSLNNTTDPGAGFFNATSGYKINNVALAAGDVGLGNVTNNAQTQAAIVPNTAPTAGQILIGNAGNTAYAKNTLSGSGATATLGATGVLTLSAIPNATLSNSAITIAGTSTSLGGSITLDTIDSGISTVGLIKRSAANTRVIATPGTDYEVPLTASQSVTRTANNFTLTGDTASPGNSKVYGTDGAGVRGWQTVAGGGTVTNIATTSPITGGPITTTGTLALDVSVDHAFTARQSIAVTDAVTNADAIVLSLDHQTSGTSTTGFGTRMLVSGETASGSDRQMGFLSWAWSDATDATRTSYINFDLTNSGSAGSRMRLFASGGLSVNSTTDPGAGIINANTGYRIGNAAASRKKLVGDGTNFIASTETWAAPGTSGNVLTSDGTNWLSSAPTGGVSAPLTLTLTNGTTNAVDTVLTLDHESSGTPAASFGEAIDFLGNTTTTANRKMGRLSAQWKIATEGSQESSVTIAAANGSNAFVNVARFYKSTGVEIGGVSGTDPGSGVIIAGTGYIAGASIPSTGKILQSNGSAMVHSTPLWPTTASTSGKVVCSNGTDLVMSTPTFPNASATSRKIIVSDGTNWVASTETHAVPGTSGNVMTSDGTNWISSAPPVDSYRVYAALGGAIVAEPPGITINNLSATHTMIDGSVEFVAVYLDVAKTLTGVKWYQGTIGNYTADNNNRLGLYTYSAGTLTLVASCANDGTLWQTAGSNTWGSKAFSSTYAAASGLLFVAFLWNNSAFVTAPVLGAGATLSNAAMAAADFTNSAKMYCSVAGTDLPATQAMSGTANLAAHTYVGLY
jgi:hypothetical protein